MITDSYEKQDSSGLSLRRRGRSALQAPIESMESGSASPFRSAEAYPQGPAALQAAWDRLYRARAILEREQGHLRDDRIVIQGEVEALEMRECTVAAREERIRQIELQLALELEEKQEAQDELDERSTLAKLTHAPFEIARSVFGTKK